MAFGFELRIVYSGPASEEWSLCGQLHRGNHLSGRGAGLLQKATFCGCTGPLGGQVGVRQRLSAVIWACFVLSDQPGHFPEGRLAPLGRGLLVHPSMGEFPAELLSLLMLAHVDPPSVWAPVLHQCILTYRLCVGCGWELGAVGLQRG